MEDKILFELKIKKTQEEDAKGNASILLSTETQDDVIEVFEGLMFGISKMFEETGLIEDPYAMLTILSGIAGFDKVVQEIIVNEGDLEAKINEMVEMFLGRTEDDEDEDLNVTPGGMN